MSIESKPTSTQQHQEATSWSQRVAEYLLALPRSAKQAILMTADFMMSAVCLYFAIAARYGYMGNHISPVSLCFYALIPVIGLYLIGFYKGVARSFFDSAMGKVLQLFLLLIVIAQGVLYLDLIPGMPRAVPILYFVSILYLALE